LPTNEPSRFFQHLALVGVYLKALNSVIWAVYCGLSAMLEDHRLWKRIAFMLGALALVATAGGLLRGHLW
jgi:hypothetical protein